MDWLACGALSAAFMFVIWQGFDPRVFVVFGIMLMVSEVIIQIRHRLSVICHFCGFDPKLYKKSSAQAAELVRVTLEKKREDPDFILSENTGRLLKQINVAQRQSKRKDGSKTSLPVVKENKSASRLHLQV